MSMCNRSICSAESLNLPCHVPPLESFLSSVPADSLALSDLRALNTLSVIATLSSLHGEALLKDLRLDLDVEWRRVEPQLGLGLGLSRSA